jgi:hypothetical protein
MLSNARPKRQQLSLLLLAISSQFLTACSHESSTRESPASIPPSQCFVDWYAKTATPSCVDDYLDKVERQQTLLAKP